MSDEVTASGPGLGRLTSPDAILLERVLPAPIDRVWTYLTEPGHLSTWLAGGSIALRLGGRIELDFAHFHCPGRDTVRGTMSGITTELDPPHLLTYSWRESSGIGPPGQESVVSFRLRAIDARQTHLTLSHRLIHRGEISGIAAGWHVHLDVLANRLTEGEPEHFMNRWASLEGEYRRLYELTYSEMQSPTEA